MSRAILGDGALDGALCAAGQQRAARSRLACVGMCAMPDSQKLSRYKHRHAAHTKQQARSAYSKNCAAQHAHFSGWSVAVQPALHGCASCMAPSTAPGPQASLTAAPAAPHHAARRDFILGTRGLQLLPHSRQLPLHLLQLAAQLAAHSLLRLPLVLHALQLLQHAVEQHCTRRQARQAGDDVVPWWCAKAVVVIDQVVAGCSRCEVGCGSAACTCIHGLDSCGRQMGKHCINSICTCVATALRMHTLCSHEHSLHILPLTGTGSLSMAPSGGRLRGAAQEGLDD